MYREYYSLPLALDLVRQHRELARCSLTQSIIQHLHLLITTSFGEFAGAANEQPCSQGVEGAAVAYFHMQHPPQAVDGIEGCPAVGFVHKYHPAFFQFGRHRQLAHMGAKVNLKP